MRYCNKCGKKLKDNDILCKACGTKTDITDDTGWLLNQADSESKSTDTADIPQKKQKTEFFNILMIIGIIILSLFIIFIIVFIWHGFMDASNI